MATPKQTSETTEARPVQVVLPVDLIEELEAAAGEWGESRSSMIRRILTEWWQHSSARERAQGPPGR